MNTSKALAVIMNQQVGAHWAYFTWGGNLKFHLFFEGKPVCGTNLHSTNWDSVYGPSRAKIVDKTWTRVHYSKRCQKCSRFYKKVQIAVKKR